ncbi:MAG: hypothetical protein WAP41_08485 [Tissierellaceae bacterium]
MYWLMLIIINRYSTVNNVVSTHLGKNMSIANMYSMTVAGISTSTT